MLYGRRRVDPSFIYSLVRKPRKRKWILDRGFQVHYTSYLTIAVSGACLLTFGAVFYFVNQNFQIFTGLAFDTHPGLVQHLEREITWLKFFIVLSFILTAVVTFILTLRMTQKLMHPLFRMERHMRKLIQGQWNIPDLHSPHEDFAELLTTYDYFYRSLRTMTERELELLQKLSVDPANREAYAAWKSLLETKSKRLGVTPFIANENDAKSVSKPHLRRVS